MWMQMCNRRADRLYQLDCHSQHGCALVVEEVVACAKCRLLGCFAQITVVIVVSFTVVIVVIFTVRVGARTVAVEC